MALLIRESEKKDAPSTSTFYVDTVAAVDEYVTSRNITFIPPSSTLPTGYLPYILSFLMLALSIVGSQMLDSIIYLALQNILLPLIRIAKRWIVAIIMSSWRRVCAWRNRGRVTSGDATSNICPPTDDKMNELSRSESLHVATAVSEVVDDDKKMDDLSPSAPSQVTTPVPKDPHSETNVHDSSQSSQSQAPSATSKDLNNEKKIEDSSQSPPSQATIASATSDGPANGDEVDKASQSAVQQTKTALSDEDHVWSNDEDSDPSSARVFDNAPISSTRKEVFAALRAMGRKDKRVANISNPTNRLSKKTTNLNGSRARLLERLRKTLDPKSRYSPKSNVLVLAREMKRNLKRANTKVLTLEMEQQSSVAEVRRTEQAAARLREQSSVTEALNAERATARLREQRLTRERDAANDRASNGVSQASYDSLRISFDMLRDQFNEAQEERKAAVDELRAEQAKTETLAQQASESTATGSTVPSDERISSLEQEALARNEAVQDAEAKAEEAKTRAEEATTRAEELEVKAREADTKAQEAEAKAQEAEAKAQEAEIKAQEAGAKAKAAEIKSEEAETRFQEEKAKVQEAETKIKEAEVHSANVGAHPQQEIEDGKHELEQRLQRAEKALAKASNGAEGTSNQESYQQGFQAAVLECEAKAQVVIAQEVDAAIIRRDAEVLGQLKTELENAVAQEKAPLQAQLNATNERATTAEEEVGTLKEEVRKYKQGKQSQDQRIQGYKDDISRLKRLIPANAALMVEELESAQRDRQRAQALLEESSVRSYDWDTKQVLKKLLEANEKIIELECVLKDARTQSNQTDLLKVLLDAEVDPQQYMSLNLPMRQVLVKQCRAVNARFKDLRTIIESSERPRKEGLLFAIYQARGDEEAFYDEDDPEPEPSSDEDEDENAANSGVQRSAPRRLNQPTSHRSRRATVPQVVVTPLPADARVHNDLKRKGFPNEPDAAPRVETRQMAGPSIGYPLQTSSSRNGEAFDQANLDPQLSAIGSTPAQHPATPNPFASTATPSHPEQAPKPKPTRISAPRQKPHLTASERQERLRYVPNPESEASPEQEAAAPTSIPGPRTFSFNMPKNIASGIRPHVRKYTSLSGMTNIVRSRRQSEVTDPEP